MKLSSVLLAFIVCVGIPTQLRAETYLHSGQACQGSSEADRSEVVYGTVQARNETGAAKIDFVCPIMWTGDTTFDPGNARVYYWDRSDSDVDGSFDCAAVIYSTGGTTSTSATRYSCSTAGGCSSQDPTYYSTSMQYLDWGTGFASGTYASWVLSCDAPAPDIGTSGVSNYSVDQT
jgi:hypothetical protein